MAALEGRGVIPAAAVPKSMTRSGPRHVMTSPLLMWRAPVLSTRDARPWFVVSGAGDSMVGSRTREESAIIAMMHTTQLGRRETRRPPVFSHGTHHHGFCKCYGLFFSLYMWPLFGASSASEGGAPERCFITEMPIQ